MYKRQDQYVAAGGTVIDTGRFYGANKDGEHACESERVLKKWFDSRNNRDQLVIMDKACHPIITPEGCHQMCIRDSLIAVANIL